MSIEIMSVLRSGEDKDGGRQHRSTSLRQEMESIDLGIEIHGMGKARPEWNTDHCGIIV